MAAGGLIKSWRLTCSSSVHSTGILLDNNNLTALPHLNMSIFNATNNVKFAFSIRNNQITTVPTNAFGQSALKL
jgi:hypothetical protein